MRISTAELNSAAVTAILNQQSALARTQTQLGTGNRLTSPADDPLAAAQLQRLNRSVAQQTQFTNNIGAATTSLNLEESATADTYTLLQRVRELALEANTSTESSSDRADIAAEVQQRLQELQGIANRQDATGGYLFSGYSTGTPAYTLGASGYTYNGDAGQRSVQVDEQNSIAMGDSGAVVFGNVRQGNGDFVTSAASANTGTGVIDVGSITSRADWVSQGYTISFTDATDWQVTDSSGTQVASGTYTSGGNIDFNGAEVSITGTPAAGDSFSIAPSATEDVFTTLQNLYNALTSPANATTAGRAQVTSQLTASLQQLDNSMDHVDSVRAVIGARLGMLDTVTSAQSARSVDVQSQISSLSDTDYTSTASKMSQQLLGLQAAQQSYAAIAKLSLFNYL
ncbi:MAG TPA: flagellar hook-associated protein FlgL [Steroidobacteraceae bacterium]|nr:flagellar hook-associated protein FlgL [Steroidobacteraceae bacterium]